MLHSTLGRARRGSLALGLLLGSFTLAQAQQVQPDATFGTAGTVTTGLTAERFNFSPVGSGSPMWSVMGQTLVQPDGKVLVCGGNANSWTLRRYNANGTADTGFGTGGSVTSVFPQSAVANGLALQPDGKIVVVGGVMGDIGNVWAAARYNADGTLDTSFGTGGLSYANIFSAGPSELARVVVLPSGKLLAVASYQHSYPTRLLRLLANGQPDVTFNTGPGGAGSAFGPSYNAIFQDMIAQPDGKVLVTTAIAGGQTPASGARLARYNTDGTPDTGFGTNGEVLFAGSSSIGGQPAQQRPTSIHGMAVQPDGKILLAGHLNNGQGIGSVGDLPALFRYNADGTPDAAFNTAVASSISTTGGLATVALQSDGRIVVAGSVSPMISSSPQLLLARYSVAGTLDASFGTGHAALPTGVYSAAAGSGALVRLLTVLPNDQLLAWEGTTASNSTSTVDMRLTRYTAARPTATRPTELALQLTAAPVPTSRELQLRYVLPTAATAHAVVRDQLGRVVATANGPQQAAGTQTLPINLARVAAGSYFVTLEAGQWRQTMRVVKQ